MEFKQLFENYAQPGKIEIIQIRPARLAPMVNVSEVLANAEFGLEGDRYKSKGGNRQVTLFQFEHLQVIASLLGKAQIDPALTRRNIVVSGLNLLSLKDKIFKIGDAVFEYSGECQPCSRMEENFGHGGYNAMRGHGGITAKVLESGLIRVGDPVFARL
jgi:MOSC domain-containing protein YiiM